MGLLDFNYDNAMAGLLGGTRTPAQKRMDAMRAQSVMSLPMGQPWRPEYEQEPALQAPTISPDDLIGTGIPSRIAGLLAAGGKAMAAKAGAGGLLGGAVAQTAWHGSPHKFDKFSLDAIGTGEGAQAYGHGLYLAESPEVAKGYQSRLADLPFPNGDERNAAVRLIEAKGLTGEKQAYEIFSSRYGEESANQMILDAKREAGKGRGSLYKTDIPDEAVARFLDWDKPLSQQDEVMDALRKSPVFGPASESWQGAPAGQWDRNIGARLGSDFYINGPSADNQQKATQLLQEAGVHGIRYLDGGSRGAGAGSSNFVAFNPEMIRILERNGQPTGLQPWQPGEWQGLLK